MTTSFEQRNKAADIDCLLRMPTSSVPHSKSFIVKVRCCSMCCVTKLIGVCVQMYEKYEIDAVRRQSELYACVL